MSRIAILGWGSLIKQPKRLPLQGGWKSDGPVLKIEFSRISNDGRLTLVIDPLGSEIKTYHARSARTELDDAICDLMIRERTSKENIKTILISCPWFNLGWIKEMILMLSFGLILRAIIGRNVRLTS